MVITKTKIWAIAGGKGGVGKSFVSLNVAVDLAQKGYKVALIDCDFGGANLHTFLRITQTSLSLSDFLYSSSINLDDFLLPTYIPKLFLATGIFDSWGVTGLPRLQQDKLIKAIKMLNVDYVVIDLGAGTYASTLDLFLCADEWILISSPEPTSMENMYRFLKSAFYRKLKHVIPNVEVRSFLEKIMSVRSEDNPSTPNELVKKIIQISDQAGEILKYELNNFCPKLVLNQIRSNQDIQIGFSICQACLKYFGITVDYIGFISYHKDILQSIRVRESVLTYAPSSQVNEYIRRITQNVRNNFHLIPA